MEIKNLVVNHEFSRVKKLDNRGKFTQVLSKINLEQLFNFIIIGFISLVRLIIRLKCGCICSFTPIAFIYVFW